MAKRLDLVLDSRLETIFDDENRTGQTGHVYVEADSTLQQRAVKRVEWWRRERCIGSGGCGTVYLERCVSGEKNVRARAVKTIQVVSSGKGRASFYDRELEAIAKFSQEKVSCHLFTVCCQGLLLTWANSTNTALSNPLGGSSTKAFSPSLWNTCPSEACKTICRITTRNLWASLRLERSRTNSWKDFLSCITTSLCIEI